MRSSALMLLLTVVFLALRIAGTLHAGTSGVLYGGAMLTLCLVNMWETHHACD